MVALEPCAVIPGERVTLHRDGEETNSGRILTLICIPDRAGMRRNRKEKLWTGFIEDRNIADQKRIWTNSGISEGVLG